MRVLLTTDTIGGVWTFTQELSQGLLHAGHGVALVSFGRAPSEEQKAWAKRTVAAFKGGFEYSSSPAPLEWMQENARAYDAGAETLLKVAASFSPDVLHSNQFCFGNLPLGIPKLITAHSDVLSWAAACLTGGLEASAWLERYCDLVQAGLNGANAVVAPTAAMRGALATHFTIPCPAYVIANGRNLSVTTATPLRVAQAVSVGRLWDQAKGLSTLLASKSPVPVLIAGEEQFEAVSASTAAPHIRPLGVLSAQELVELFCKSSVYLATSVYEPFGLAALEAALCGCAVLARDIPSLREVWEGGAMYFRSSADLERQLGSLFASPACLLAARTAAQDRAQHFTAERMTAAYVALCERLTRRAQLEVGAQLGVGAQQEFAAHAA